MRVLVVGATGGLGREVVATASAGGHAAVALVRHTPDPAFPPGVEMVQGDVLDPPSLTAAVGKSDAVICALAPRARGAQAPSWERARRTWRERWPGPVSAAWSA